MELTSQITAILEQNRLQAASTAALSSQVAKLSSTVARLSADNAHLSSENADLKLKVADQNKVLAEVSRAAILGGHWVWESASAGSAVAGGRWAWSLEHYQPPSSAVVRSGPSASLLSLPVELLAIIVAMVPVKELPRLSLVCFRLLEVASRLIYPSALWLRPRHAARFVCARLEHAAEKSPRISNLLLPSQLHLVARFQHECQFALGLFFGSDGIGAIEIEGLILDLASVQLIHNLVPLLSRLNPKGFELRVGEREGWKSTPTVYRLSQAAANALFASWTRLERTYSVGPESVLVSALEGSELALEDHLRRAAQVGDGTARVSKRLVSGGATEKQLTRRLSRGDIALSLGAAHSKLSDEIDLVCLYCLGKAGRSA